MSTPLSRALTRLTISLGALVVLAALGQPIPSAPTNAASSEMLDLARQLPLVPRVIRALGEEVVVISACESNCPEPDEVNDDAADALARSALRMRWLLTSPSASSRSCGMLGCAG